MERYVVWAAAEMASVSVRTLHHHDHIGPLRPTTSTAPGYRLYAAADLECLQQVLFFRELGFPLREIKAIVDGPTFGWGEALRAHRRLLVAKRDRFGQLVELADRTIDALQKGRPTADERSSPASATRS